MSIKSTGDIYINEDTVKSDDNQNRSLAYEVYKYTPTGDVDLNQLITDAKDSGGNSPSWDSMEDFRNWARHNSHLWLKCTDLIFNVEVHVSDHTDPPISGDQFPDPPQDYGDGEHDVGELWGDGTPTGDTNNIDFTKDDDVAIASGDNVEYRYRSRDRYSSTWGSFTSWIDYTSGGINVNMRDKDFYFELRQTWGRLYASNFDSVGYQLDLDGVDYSVATTDDITLKVSDVQGTAEPVKFQSDAGNDLDDNDLAVRIFRRDKNTSDAWLSVWPSSGDNYATAAWSLGYDSVADVYTCNFSLYDYLFEIDKNL